MRGNKNKENLRIFPLPHFLSCYIPHLVLSPVYEGNSQCTRCIIKQDQHEVTER